MSKSIVFDYAAIHKECRKNGVPLLNQKDEITERRETTYTINLDPVTLTEAQISRLSKVIIRETHCYLMLQANTDIYNLPDFKKYVDSINKCILHVLYSNM